MARSSVALPCRHRGREQHQGELRARRSDRDAPEGGEGEAAADRGAGRVEVVAWGGSPPRPPVFRRSPRPPFPPGICTTLAPPPRPPRRSPPRTREPLAN